MNIQSLYPQDLEQYLSQKNETDYQLVDVRQPQEYEVGHIPGAKLIPLSELEARLDELDAQRELIFYCRSGRRSSMGAVFARDSGLAERAIYNLVGGIDGWEGRTLDEFPKFEVFQEAQDWGQTLEQAINMEKGTMRLYEAMVAKSAGHMIESTLNRLARMETAHARTIYRFLAEFRELPLFEEYFESLAGDIVEGGWDLDEAEKRLRRGKKNSCLFLAELALELEYRAYDLYRSMAEAAKVAEQQKAMFSLSEQEKSHVRLLTRGLPGCF